MQPDNTHKTMLAALIVIGIIIIVILVAPRTGIQYGYTGNTLTASALQMQTSAQQQPSRSTGTFTVVRYIPIETSSSYRTNSNYTSYSYPSTQTYTQYSSYQDSGVVFPDGCTLTSPVSTTTGQPCS